jgi:hypothetical protein
LSLASLKTDFDGGCRWSTVLREPRGGSLRLDPLSGFLAFLLLALSQAYPWTDTILVDELYAGGFQGQTYFGAGLVTTA